MRHRGPRMPDTSPPHKSGWKRNSERRRSPRGAEARAGDGAVILYGWHTVKAALENPARRIRRLFATENAARRLAEDGLTPAVEDAYIEHHRLERMGTALIDPQKSAHLIGRVEPTHIGGHERHEGRQPVVSCRRDAGRRDAQDDTRERQSVVLEVWHVQIAVDAAGARRQI